jgi:antitoxin ParD1/3/4
MPEVHKVTVALTGEQVAALKAAVETGEYATTSEIVRDALRDWQRKRELHGQDVEQLRKLWAQGKRSGPALPADLAKVREQARRRLEKTPRRTMTHAG